jgi:hypothetical protein
LESHLPHIAQKPGTQGKKHAAMNLAIGCCDHGGCPEVWKLPDDT